MCVWGVCPRGVDGGAHPTGMYTWATGSWVGVWVSKNLLFIFENTVPKSDVIVLHQLNGIIKHPSLNKKAFQ